MFLNKIKKQQGVTLIELSIAIVISGVIFLGLFVLINRVTKGIWSLGGNIELTGQASEAMSLIGQDFRCAKASTMGNLAKNPGFEDPTQLSAAPTDWELPTGSVLKTGYSGPNIKSGLLAIKVLENTTYRSNSFNIPAGKNFILSGWVIKPGSINIVKASDNSNLIPLVSNANFAWTHLTSTVNLVAAETAKLQLTTPAASWGVCSTPAPGLDKDITEMVSYKNRLYVGGWENARTYSYSGTAGVAEGSIGYGINPHVTALGVFDPDGFGPLDEVLIFNCGFWDWGNSASWHYWRPYYHNSTGGWVAGWPVAGEYPQWNTGLPYAGPDSGWGSGRHFMRCGTTYQNRLYVGTGGYVNAGFFGDFRVYDPTGPAGWKWTTLFTTTERMVISICVYNNRVYAGTASSSGSWHLPTGTGNIYVHDIALGTTTLVPPWPPAVGPTSPVRIMDMAIFNGGSGERLYVAAGNLYICDGTVWQPPVNTLGVVSTLCVYGGALYAGNWAGGIYRTTDGVNWTVCPGIGQTVRRLRVNDNTLYAGGSNGGWGNPRVLIWSDESCYDDVSISPEEVIFDNTTVANGIDNVYQYYTSKGETEATFNRFKLYRLRYEPTTRKLYRETSNDGGTSWVPRGQQNDGTICENVKKFRIFNHGQESFEVELTLEKILPEGKSKEYQVKTSIKPEIS